MLLLLHKAKTNMDMGHPNAVKAGNRTKEQYSLVVGGHNYYRWMENSLWYTQKLSEESSYLHKVLFFHKT